MHGWVPRQRSQERPPGDESTFHNRNTQSSGQQAWEWNQINVSINITSIQGLSTFCWIFAAKYTYSDNRFNKEDFPVVTSSTTLYIDGLAQKYFGIRRLLISLNRSHLAKNGIRLLFCLHILDNTFHLGRSHLSVSKCSLWLLTNNLVNAILWALTLMFFFRYGEKHWLVLTAL